MPLLRSLAESTPTEAINMPPLRGSTLPAAFRLNCHLPTAHCLLPFGCAARADGLKLTEVSDAQFLLIAVAVGVVLVAAALLLRRSRRGEGPMVEQTRAMPKMKGSLDAGPQGRSINVALGREILGLLEAGRRVEAAALVRERTGWGAREADEAIVKLEKLMERLES
jgi:hypothetical protein